MTTEEVVVVLAAVLVGSLVKSISGVGLPLIAVPAITYVADIELAVAVIALPNLALNLALAWRERASLPSTRDLPILGIAGLVGGVVGTVVLVSLPEEPLVGLLVVIVAMYALMYFSNPEFTLDPHVARRFAPAVGLAAGAMQGAVGISGPIVASWIHSYRLPRGAYVLSVTVLFAFAGVAQIPTLTVSGEMGGRWTVAIVACVPALATVPAGARLRNMLSTDGFDRVVVVTLVAAVAGLAVRTFL